MSKTRKLIKALEADGWTEAVERDGVVQFTKAGQGQRLTLPAGKFAISPDLANDVAALAGVSLKGE